MTRINALKLARELIAVCDSSMNKTIELDQLESMLEVCDEDDHKYTISVLE